MDKNAIQLIAAIAGSVSAVTAIWYIYHSLLPPVARRYDKEGFVKYGAIASVATVCAVAAFLWPGPLLGLIAVVGAIVSGWLLFWGYLAEH